MQTLAPTVRFNTQRMAEDMATKGWTKLQLATKAKVADMTVIRFLRGERQTNKTAKKLSVALGQSVERYIVRQSPAEVSLCGPTTSMFQRNSARW